MSILDGTKKPLQKSFQMSKDIVELDLSSSHVSVQVWIVGIGMKRCNIFNNGQKWISIS